MRINVPASIRVWLYVLTGLGTPIIAVLTSPEVNVLPYWVMLIWAGEVTFVGTMAGLNVANPVTKEEK